jgi:hypothetical protein
MYTMETEKKVGRPRKKIPITSSAVAEAAPAEPVAAEPVVAAKPSRRKINIKAAGAPAPSKRKINIKPAAVQGETVLAKISPGFPLIVAETVTVKVTPLTVDGRSLYYNAAKGKVYDLKFKYLGRLKEGAIISFPDSDAET